MRVLIMFDDGHDYGEFEYFSDFTSLTDENFEKVEEEAYYKLRKAFGYRRGRKITRIYNLDEE